MKKLFYNMLWFLLVIITFLTLVWRVDKGMKIQDNKTVKDIRNVRRGLKLSWILSKEIVKELKAEIRDSKRIPS